MTLWFVFALMTVAAIFAVLWPLGRRGRPQGGGSETTVYRDQLAEIDRDLATGLIGSSEAEAARVEISRRLLAAADNQRDPPAAVEPPVAPFRGGAGAGRIADPVVSALPPARLAAAWRFSAGAAHPRAGRHPVARQSGGAGRSASGEKSDRWPRLERACAGAVETRPLRRRGRGPIAIRSPTAATAPSAGPISAKPWSAAAGGVVTAEAKAEFDRAIAHGRRRGQGELLPRPCRRAGRPDRRRRIDLAVDARKGAAGCAVAAAGAGGAGAGRRSGRSSAVRRCHGCGQGHERSRPRRDDPRHGRSPRQRD